MEKKEQWYQVTNGSGRSLNILAKTSERAKRIYCQIRGIRPGDYWNGITTLKARKLKPEEIQAWEEQSRSNQETLLFIQGMMDICVKANKDK